MSAIWPAEFKPLQEGLFRSLAEAAGGGRRLLFVPLRLRGFPETQARADEALRRAKRQPRFFRAAKRAMLAAQYNWSRHWFSRHQGDVALVWNGLTGTRWAFAQGARDAGARRLYCELAPLPGYVTIDPVGVNAEGSAALAEGRALVIPDLFARLRSTITARASRRADVTQGAGDLTGARPFLFVPLQVPGDSQITLFADWVGDLPGFIAALAVAAADLPEGWQIRVKEHPSARISLAAHVQAATVASGGRMVADNATDTFQLVEASRGVVTVNSSVGLQAMLWDKPVIATGRAFWARRDLCEVAGSASELAATFARADTVLVPTRRREEFLSWLVNDYLVPLPADVASLRLRFL